MRFIVKDITGRFVYWIHKGLIYTRDSKPKTPNNTFKYIVQKKEWVEDPTGVAKKVLEESKNTLCNNSPLTRLAIIGTLSDPVSAAVNFCTLTHVDTRCVATCVFYGCVINSLIYNHIHTAEKIDGYVVEATNVALEHLDKSYHEEFKALITQAMRAHVKSFKLNEMSCASNIYKALQCICYGLHVVRTAVSVSKYPDFKKCIETVVAEGGDADANGAVTGSIIGAYLGYSRIPRDWVYAMPHHWSLNQFVAIYISRLFAPTSMEENEHAAEQNRAANAAKDVTKDVPDAAPNTSSTPDSSVKASSALTMADINSLVIDPDSLGADVPKNDK